MTVFHPHIDDHGRPVAINHPSTPTPLETWTDPEAAATVTPGGPMPASLNGIAFDSWAPPASATEWASVVGQADINEPPFSAKPGKDAAAGCIIEEADGRIWLVSPSNGHGGYTSSFPKGRIDAGASLQACAIREAFEESGLKVVITGFIADSNRTRTTTRYYRARRITGNPADAGWESQAVHLVPRTKLAEYLTNPNDKPFISLLGG